LAAEWFNEKAILETDCKSLAAMLQNKEGLKSRLHFIIREAQAGENRLPAWRVEYARREQNRAMHELAQLAKRTKHSAVRCLRCPSCIEQIVAQEYNNSTSKF
ncbi:hypothetical protein BAE44_0018364, partial [Dichanthelium oligosanthes]